MVMSNLPQFSAAMKRRLVGDPLTKGKHMHAYKQREVPWPGKYCERTYRLRVTCAEAMLRRSLAYFRDTVYEDEKTFTMFGMINRQNHR